LQVHQQKLKLPPKHQLKLLQLRRQLLLPLQRKDQKPQNSSQRRTRVKNKNKSKPRLKLRQNHNQPLQRKRRKEERKKNPRVETLRKFLSKLSCLLKKFNTSNKQHSSKKLRKKPRELIKTILLLLLELQLHSIKSKIDSRKLEEQLEQLRKTEVRMKMSEKNFIISINLNLNTAFKLS
jgi:hypothetical protein